MYSVYCLAHWKCSVGKKRTFLLHNVRILLNKSFYWLLLFACGHFNTITCVRYTCSTKTTSCPILFCKCTVVAQSILTKGCFTQRSRVGTRLGYVHIFPTDVAFKPAYCSLRPSSNGCYTTKTVGGGAEVFCRYDNKHRSQKRINPG